MVVVKNAPTRKLRLVCEWVRHDIAWLLSGHKPATTPEARRSA